MPENKEHTMTCNDCHRFMSEMMNLDRENIRKDFRKIVREEWQNTYNTQSDVKLLKKRSINLFVSNFIQWGVIGYIILKIFTV